MKKPFALIAGLAVILSISISCKDKNSKNAITPDYGATGNPYPNNQTVTGSTTFTSPATQNTSFEAGGIGWSNPSCISTASLALRSTEGLTDVLLTFASPPPTGTVSTYAIGGTPGTGVCALTVINAPDQPAGVVWYGKSGTVSVSTTSTSINAALGSGIVCTQKDFNFPHVVVTGVLGCSQ